MKSISACVGTATQAGNNESVSKRTSGTGSQKTGLSFFIVSTSLKRFARLVRRAFYWARETNRQKETPQRYKRGGGLAGLPGNAGALFLLSGCRRADLDLGTGLLFD